MIRGRAGRLLCRLGIHVTRPLGVWRIWIEDQYVEEPRLYCVRDGCVDRTSSQPLLHDLSRRGRPRPRCGDPKCYVSSQHYHNRGVVYMSLRSAGIDPSFDAAHDEVHRR